ncbi:hypothetical protein Dsin_021556 [Dipteronia sinensis]|uniref:Glycosyltransferase n=1 Tax=Dipteronia sinensis TaxID=43782 RepID=A0AAE0A1D4_9ROSI|nr:hypothetical protein Dsin_021556 [Dipteronia sinensis]
MDDLPKTKYECHILAVPLPTTGHINPMMNLCKLLASKKPDLLITFVIEETYTSSSTANFPHNIRFSFLPNNILPSVESLTANEISDGQAILTKLGAPLEEILDSFTQTTHPVTTILTDFLLSSIVHAGAHRNIPVAGLWINALSEFSMHCHTNLFKEKQFPTDLEEHANDVVDFIPGISPLRVSDLPRFFLENGQNWAIDAWNLELATSKIQYLLCTSVYEIESQVCDFLRQKFNFSTYPCGPLIPYFDQPSTETPHDYIEWLNSQPINSVLYVSMGSSFSLSSAQTDEMAAGLISSGVRFLWVGRKNSLRLKEACSGYELGLVVQWCDQLSVLGHSSVGGFLTHNGFSSTLEAGFSGVPMLTFPIAGDQFLISKLVVEDWKVGWRLREELGVGNESLITSREAIAKTVHKFMDINGSERRELSERSKRFQEIVKGATSAKGGSSDASLDAFIKDITQGHAH